MRHLDRIMLFMGIGILVASIVVSLYGIDWTYAEHIIASHKLAGSILLGGIMFLATVLGPISAYPLLIASAPYLGPFVAGLSCSIGWILGSQVSFFISRKFGKQILLHFISNTTLESLERKVQGKITFVALVVLRMILPVDALSYALGLTNKITYRANFWSSFFGIPPLAFTGAYLGASFIQGDYIHFLWYGLGTVIFFGLVFYYHSQ